MGERVAASDVPEDDLRRGVIYTRVSPAVAWCMTLSFLLLVFGLPLLQAAVEVGRGGRPRALDLFLRDSFPDRHELKAYEEALQEHSVVRAAIQPHVQEQLTRVLRFGNNHFVVGRDGWLFYRPGVEYVVGCGFLEPERLRQRRAEMAEDGPTADAEPDPRPAILQFKKDCDAARVHLVLVPVPDKVTVQPGQFFNGSPSRRAPAPPPHNRSYAAFVAEMRAAGVDVFDPTPPLVGPGEVRFLVRDTHWTPQWMSEVAASVANHLRPTLGGALGLGAAGAALRVSPREVRCAGDMDVHKVFPPQTVTIRRVLDASGSPFRPREEADVLVLGDSFSTIYSDAMMGWGKSAGFVEHLSLHLGRPVDAIVRNGEGAWGSRGMLAKELARGRDRLAGKNVVVWQFAARELAVGNWKVIDLKRPAAPGPAATPGSASPGAAGGFLSLKRGETLRVSGVVKVIGAAPRPGTVPYKDHVVAAHLSDVRDEQGRPRGEAVVYLWSMRDNKAAPAAGYRVGQTVTLRVRPWAEVSRQYGSVNRRELPDPALLTVDPLWAEEETP
jgi:alginate O-acetyltransferase complex protein AlgJ